MYEIILHIYNVKSKGPKIDPCEKPDAVMECLEELLPYLTT